MPRCREPSLFAGTISTSSRSIKGTMSVKPLFLVDPRGFLTSVFDQVWEETLQHPCPRLTVLPCQRRWSCHHWPVQAVVKDGEVQCAEGDPSRRICLCKEGIHWNVRALKYCYFGFDFGMCFVGVFDCHWLYRDLPKITTFICFVFRFSRNQLFMSTWSEKPYAVDQNLLFIPIQIYRTW